MTVADDDVANANKTKYQCICVLFLPMHLVCYNCLLIHRRAVARSYSRGRLSLLPRLSRLLATVSTEPEQLTHIT